LVDGCLYNRVGLRAHKPDVTTKSKIALIYVHLTFLFFPFVLLTANSACGTLCFSCHNNYGQLFAYSLPATLLISTLAGTVAIPALYTRAIRRRLTKGHVFNFVKKYSRKMGVKPPQLYLVDKARPVAFSFRSLRSSIFVSIGAMEILSKKEKEAVLLHEMAHIKERSSLMKFSLLLMKLSPFSLLGFHHDAGEEESKADRYAISVQGTDRYIMSAKKKFGAFDKFN